MHPAMIQALLKMSGLTQADIAKRCNKVSPTLVGKVIHGRDRSRKVETYIAAAVGIPREELWPQWYGPDAQRKERLSIAQRAAALARLNALRPEHESQEAA